MRRILFVSLILAALAGGGWVYLHFTYNGQDKLYLSGFVESQEIRLGSKIGGRVEAVEVFEGQTVQPGQVLVRIAIPELLAQRKQAEARLQAAQAQLDKAKSGPREEEILAAKAAWEAAQARLKRTKRGWRDEEIKQAQSELESAEADVKLAREEMERVLLAARQAGVPVTKKELDAARAELSRSESRRNAAYARWDMYRTGSREEDILEAQSEADKLEAQYLLLKKGTRPEDIDLALAQVEEARGRLQQIEADCEEAVVRSPAVAYVEVVAVRAGDLVAPNQPVVRILKTEDVWIKVFVPETKLGKVKKNQEAVVTIDSHPGRTFKGSVTHIASIAEFLPRNVQSPEERKNQVFFVKVTLTEPEAVAIFKPGMAANVVLSFEP